MINHNHIGNLKVTFTIQQLIFFQLCCFFAILLLPVTYVTLNVKEVVSLIRLALIFVFSASILLQITLYPLDRQPRHSIVLVALYLVVIFYGCCLAFFYGGIEYFKEIRHWLILTVSVAFSYVLGHQMHRGCDDVLSHISAVKSYIVFLMVLMFFMSHSLLQFTPFPQFDFAQSLSGGRYSRGISYFFAVSAIFFVCMSCRQKGAYHWVSIFIVLISLLLSLAGGSRGIVLVSTALSVVIFLRYSGIKLLVIFVAFLGASIVIWMLYFDGISTVFFDRFMAFERSWLGGRGELFSQAFSLIAEQPQCVFFGCGFNYFQTYHSLEFGSYPHNVLLELLITYGAIFTLSLITFAIISIWKMYVFQGPPNFLYYFLCFELGLSIFSGSLVSFTLMPALLFFAKGAKKFTKTAS